MNQQKVCQYLRELETGTLFRFVNVPNIHTVFINTPNRHTVFEYRGNGWYSVPDEATGDTVAGPYYLERASLVRPVIAACPDCGATGNPDTELCDCPPGGGA